MNATHGYSIAPTLRSDRIDNSNLRFQVRGPGIHNGTPFETREQCVAFLAQLRPCACGVWHLAHAPIFGSDGHKQGEQP